MKGKAIGKSNIVGLILLTIAAAIFLLAANSGVAMQAAKSTKKADHLKAFKVYQQKCLGCHDSIADPEKPGRTRDDWHLVVNVMHEYGMDMNADEKEMVVDLLYNLRKGLEKEAG
jgi:hypothetical protein